MFHVPSVRSKPLSRKDAPPKPNMAKKNADKSYGWYKAQDFGDYIERVVGEINIKLVSIVITNIFLSGEYGQELEKKKFEDKDETDYLDSLHFCADLVWFLCPALIQTQLRNLEY